MPLIFTQTDTSAGCGTVAGCSGLSLVGSPIGREASIGGTAGSTENTVSLPANVTRAAYMYEMVPAVTDWNSGTWTIRINLTTADGSGDSFWEEAYVCRFNSSCTNLATLGSNTTINTRLSNTGTYTATVSQGSDVTANKDDIVYIVLGFDNNNAFSSRTIGLTPSLDIDSPYLGVNPNKIIVVTSG